MTGPRRIEIIATLNANKLTRRWLRDLLAHGVSILRLNGAHVGPRDLGRLIDLIRRVCDPIPIMVDLPGNKIRTRGLETTYLRSGESFKLGADNFSYNRFLGLVEPGDVLISTDGQLQMVAEDVSPHEATFRALCDGELLNDKGIHLPDLRMGELPFLFERDLQLLEEAIRSQVDYVGFSFVRRPAEVEDALARLRGTSVRPIIKLETREATSEPALTEILDLGERFLIDRGDLASEVGLEAFPATFDRTLRTSVGKGKAVFVATQLFASMCLHSLPHLSEVMEFDRLLKSGIAGVQLSEETAVGRYPLEVLSLIGKMVGPSE